MEENEVLLPYGNEQINLRELLNRMSDNIGDYVNQQSWSKKRKERFMNAYSDIVSKGITGANNTSGQWALDVALPLNLNGMSRKDLEMYHEAAYYILQHMKGLSPLEGSSSKKDSELEAFGGTKKLFDLYISNQLFGGNNWDLNEWDSLDERDREYGLLSRTKRMAKLAELLDGFGLSLGDYNFEGTAFKDKADLQTRIQKAVTALRAGEFNLNVKDTLNAVGIGWKDYLNDGSEDEITLLDGTKISRKQYLEALEQQQLEKLKAEEVKAAAEASAKAGILKLVSGISGTDARTNAKAYQEYLAGRLGVGLQGFNLMNVEVQGLLDKAYSGKLSNAEKRQLGNYLYYIRTNNPNYMLSNISDLDWEELNVHNNLQSQNKEGFVRLPWKTKDGRYTFADDRGNVYFLRPRNNALLANPSFNRSLAYNDYKNNFLKNKRQLNEESPVLKQDTDVLIADITSMIGDVVSLGGGLAGVGGGVTSLLSDLYGDIRRGKDTWSVLKNVGANIAWGAAGIIPGAKLGKLARNAARIYATIQSAGIILNPEIQKSWKNLIDGKGITAKDFENFKWTLHAITGGTNAARGHFTERNVDKLIKNKPIVETKSGKNVTLTEKQIAKINKAGGRKGLAEAEKVFKEITGEEVKPGTFKFLDDSRAWYNPNKYSKRLRDLFSEDERLRVKEGSINQAAVNRLLEIDKSKPIIAPFSRRFWTSGEWKRSGNPFNRKFWNEGGPNRGELSFYLNPHNSVSSVNNEKQKIAGYLPEPYDVKRTTPLDITRPYWQAYARSSSYKALPEPTGLLSVESAPSSYVPTIMLQLRISGILPTGKQVVNNINQPPNPINRPLRELKDFQDIYFGNKNTPLLKLSTNGFKSTIPEANSSYTFTSPDGTEIKLSINKVPKNLDKFRKANAKKVKEAFGKVTKNNKEEYARVVFDLKKMGYLKKGGQIYEGIDKTISEFLSKLK